MKIKTLSANYFIFIEGVLISLLFISVIILRFRDFFIIDDALNEYIPYYRQYGKNYLNGIFPFVLDNTFGGTNTLSQLSKSPLAPQNIILAILSRFIITPWKAGAIFGFINYFIVSFAVLKLAGFLFKNKAMKLLCVGFVLIQPVTLYQYAGWWNMLNGNSWAIVCFCILTYVLFNEKLSINSQIILFLSETFLFFSGFVNAIIAVGSTHFLVLCYFLFKKRVKESIDLIFVGAIPVIVFLFIYADYISYMINGLTWGYSDFINNGGLAVDWKLILLNFWPTVYQYIKYFSGYNLIPIQWAFTSQFFLVAALLFFRKKFDFRDVFFISNIIIFFLFSNSPETIGQIHYSLRNIPFFTFFVTVYTFYIIDYSYKHNFNISKKQVLFTFFAVASIFIVSYSSSLGIIKNNLLLNLSSALFVIFVTLKYRLIINLFSKKYLTYCSLALPLLSLAIFLFAFKTLGGTNVLYFQPFKFNKFDQANKNFYYLAIDANEKSSNLMHRLWSGKFLAYDLPSVNGYSTAHQKDLRNIFGWGANHLIFDREKTLKFLFKENGFAHTCNARSLNIGNISISNGSFANYIDGIKKCDYNIIENNDGITDIKIVNYLNQSYNEPYLWSDSKISYKIVKNSPNELKLLLKNPNSDVNVVLPRVFWPQYSLYINGVKLALNYNSAFPFIHFTVNKGSVNTVDLIYIPIFLKHWVLFVTLILILTALKALLNQIQTHLSRSSQI